MNVIGIGAGSSSFVTAEAAEAIAATDVFVVIDKGSEKADLVGVRREILDRFAGSRPCRLVVVEDGQRDDRLPYAEAAARWHAGRVEEFERVLAADVADHEVSGILVWGDPSLYDSTLRIIDQVNDRGRVRVEHTVGARPGHPPRHIRSVALYVVGAMLEIGGAWLEHSEPDSPSLEPEPAASRSAHDVIPDTNAIESLNARFRRATRARRHFPNEEAALKCLYSLSDRSTQGHRAGAADEPPGPGAERVRDHLRRPPLLRPYDHQHQ